MSVFVCVHLKIGKIDPSMLLNFIRIWKLSIMVSAKNDMKI